MTKADLVEWRSFPVTREIINILRDRVDQLQFELGQSAGLNPAEDRFKCGAIGAYTDILNIEVDTDD